MKLRSWRNSPVAVAATVWALLLIAGAIRFDHFASPSNIANLLSDYAFVCIAVCGATFVIFTGGIDLSCGAMVAFTGVLTAKLVQAGWHPLAAATLCMSIGTLSGAAMGGLISSLSVPPFIITLAGMFAIRASAFALNGASLPVSHNFLRWLLSDTSFSIAGVWMLDARQVIMAALLMFAWLVAARTRFGIHVYAIGGDSHAAATMGVHVSRVRTIVYAFAGLCSSLAGTICVWYSGAGDPNGATGLELTVIASAVIGGTSLAGGRGSVWGSFVGVMILGTIRLLLDFQGSLNAAWTSVATGALLLVFALFQRLVRGK